MLAMKQSLHKMSRTAYFTAAGVTGQAMLAPFQTALEKLGCAVAVRVLTWARLGVCASLL